MKSLFANAKKPSQHAEPVDLDVTPVMNMFVILIPFLVSMAVFTHYSVLEFSLPPNAGVDGGGPSRKDLKLTVVLMEKQFELTLGDSLLSTISREQEDKYLKDLEKALAEVRPQLAKQNEVVVAVNDGIQFESVVEVMDSCKKTGFEKVALAEGPGKTTVTKENGRVSS